MHRQQEPVSIASASHIPVTAAKTGVVAFLRSEAVLLAGLPVAAYGFALLYEQSFLRYFHIDGELTRVDPTHVFIAITSCFVFIILGYQLTYLVGMAAPARITPVLKETLRASPTLLLVALIIIFYRSDSLSYWPVLIWTFPSLVYPAFVFGAAIIIIRKRRKKCRFQAAVRWAQRVPDAQTQATETMLKWFGKAVYILAGIIFGSFLAVGLGRSAAAAKSKFMVLNGDKNLIVIRAYADYWICVPCDQYNQPKGDGYILLTIDQVKSYAIHLEKIDANWEKKVDENP